MHITLLSGLRDMLIIQLGIQGRVLDQISEMLQLHQCTNNHAPECIRCNDLVEIVELIDHISSITGIPSSVLKRRFGEVLLLKVISSTPHLTQQFTNTFDLLETLEERAHKELNADDFNIDMPEFDCVKEANRLTMMYRSPWPLADVIEGVILGCITYFGEPIQIHKETLSSTQGDNTLFVLSKMA